MGFDWPRFSIPLDSRSNIKINGDAKFFFKGGASIFPLGRYSSRYWFFLRIVLYSLWPLIKKCFIFKLHAGMDGLPELDCARCVVKLEKTTYGGNRRELFFVFYENKEPVVLKMLETLGELERENVRLLKKLKLVEPSLENSKVITFIPTDKKNTPLYISKSQYILGKRFVVPKMNNSLINYVAMLQNLDCGKPISIEDYLFFGRCRNTRYEEILNLLIGSYGFSSNKISPGVSHGDFAPYNIIFTSQGITAIDWEMAREGRNILYDVIYYYILLKVCFTPDISFEDLFLRMNSSSEELFHKLQIDKAYIHTIIYKDLNDMLDYFVKYEPNSTTLSVLKSAKIWFENTASNIKN